MNNFTTIETALRALRAQQKSMQVTGHNIANANTEGYSRQRAIHATTSPYTVPGLMAPAGAGQVGTGVKIEQIMRIKDDFITARLNHELQNLGAWEARKDYLSQIEMVLNEPSENGLRSLLDKFWNAWQELSNNPDSQGVRSAVKQQALTLIDGFHHTYQQLQELRQDINHDIGINVTKINTVGEKIAQLNKQIVAVEADSRKNANDLRDKRDLLVKQLSELINVQTYEDSRGNLNLSIGGVSFVSGDHYNQIGLQDAGGVDRPIWTHLGVDVNITSGKLKGALDVRDNELPNYLQQLDNLAAALINEVNTQHNAGYELDGPTTGINFFAPAAVTADIITLDPAIEASLNNIAAASNPNAPGDGSNALAIAQLKDKLTMAAGTATFNDFYTSIVSKLGVDSSKAEMMKQNQKVLVDSLENRQESISGVSLDEEMANMIKFQHAYNAAARLISRVDQMLNTLINGII